VLAQMISSTPHSIFIAGLGCGDGNGDDDARRIFLSKSGRRRAHGRARRQPVIHQDDRIHQLLLLDLVIGLAQRFGRNPARCTTIPSPTHNPDFATRFDVEGYLYYQGDALARRFDANSYLYISRAMDLFDISEGYPSLEDALRRISSKALFVGIRSDFLFPSAQVRRLAEQVRSLGGDATYIELDSPHGHDAFLKEWDQMTDALNQL